MAKLDKRQLTYFKNPNFLRLYLQVLNSRLIYSNNLIEEDNGPIDKLFDNANVLTLNDNFRAFAILLNKIRPGEDKTLNEEIIKKVANTINRHAMYISDNYRTNTNTVKFKDKYPIDDSKDIEKNMKKLLENYYGEWSKLDVFEREALFNIEFLRIHPFEDGNGRTSRLILNYNAIRQGHAPIIIPERIREEYFHARNTEDKKWIQNLFERESEKELKVINELIDSFEQEEKIDFDYKF